MNINFKTNIRTVIRYKGQEYSSADALPAEVRSVYAAAFAKGIATLPGAKQQIVLNGQHFASAGEMPPAEKKLYKEAMGVVQDSVGSHDRVPVPSKSSLAWLTPNQMRLVLLVGANIALGLALRLFL